MGRDMSEEEIFIRLSKAEALVLFDWLAGQDLTETVRFSHPSEEKVLWRMQGQLESVLAEPFASNYKSLLAEARNVVGSK